MAAPDYVPTDPVRTVRAYRSPPRRPGSWVADRPGEVRGGQPSGGGLGSQGPDQGYGLRLAGLFEDRLLLGAVDHEDAVAGCVAVASKRAALFGRAPIVHDLTAAFTVFGFLDQQPDADLVRWREAEFSQVRSSHHYAERRAIVDRVDAGVLARPLDEITAAYHDDWRRNLGLTTGPHD